MQNIMSAQLVPTIQAIMQVAVFVCLMFKIGKLSEAAFSDKYKFSFENMYEYLCEKAGVPVYGDFEWIDFVIFFWMMILYACLLGSCVMAMSSWYTFMFNL